MIPSPSDPSNNALPDDTFPSLLNDKKFIVRGRASGVGVLVRDWSSEFQGSG